MGPQKADTEGDAMVKCPFRKSVDGPPEGPPEGALNVVTDYAGSLADAVSAASSGQTIWIPADTTISVTGVTWKTGVKLLGAGQTSVVERTTTTGPVINCSGKNDWEIKNCKVQFASIAPGDAESASCVAVGSPTSGWNVEDVWMANGYYAMKISYGSSGVNSGTVTNPVVLSGHNPFYVSYSSYLTFTNVVAEATRTGTISAPPHHFYVNAGVSHMTVDGYHLTGGKVDYWCIQIYPGPSVTDINFNDGILDEVGGGIVVAGSSGAISHVTFDGIYGRSTRKTSNEAWFKAYDDVSTTLFTDFDLADSFLVEVDTTTDSIQLTNGSITSIDAHSPSGVLTSGGTAPTLTNVTVS